MAMLRNVRRWAGASLIVTVVLATSMYFVDMHRARERVSENGSVISSPYGNIEYAEGGTGPAVLVIHGSGGGYDQGELIAEAVLTGDVHWIAPSRFGYLRSDLKDGATWDDQANAYAYLLDTLAVEKVAVVAMSQGGPSALMFAVLHPERTSSLTLISSGVASASTDEQAQANAKGDMLTTVFTHDSLYWFSSKFFKKQLMTLMGADDAVVASLTPDQRELFERFIDYMNPVSLRSRGAAFDNRAAMPGDRIAAITAPTLIFHATDDTLQLYHNAEYAAAMIPNARLMTFERGGHFLIGVEQTAIRAALVEMETELPGKGE